MRLQSARLDIAVNRHMRNAQLCGEFLDEIEFFSVFFVIIDSIRQRQYSVLPYENYWSITG